jgi:hypothetical protein
MRRLYSPTIRLPTQRELKRQPRETEAQISRRRGTLITLDVFEGDKGHLYCVAAMAYMADL